MSCKKLAPYAVRYYVRQWSPNPSDSMDILEKLLEIVRNSH